jgi:DNA-binding MurR/RpiR family transcriptional regulator
MPKRYYSKASPELLREYQEKAMAVRRERYMLRCVLAANIFSQSHNIQEVADRFSVNKTTAYRMVNRANSP